MMRHNGKEMMGKGGSPTKMTKKQTHIKGEKI
jgi:hypothetical protein